MSAKIPPKPTKDVIYIDVDDEITSIIDKVENSKHKVVALVLPKRAASMQSIVNMKLLKRSAELADKNPVLITSEAALLPLAGAAGLHVAKNLQTKPEIPDAPAGSKAAAGLAAGAAAAAIVDSASSDDLPDGPDEANEEDLPKKIDYANAASIGALAAAHESENPETIDLADEDEADNKSKPKAAKAPKDKKNKIPDFDRFRMMLGLGIAGLVGLIIFIILAISVLPKAKILITTTSEPVSANFNMTASQATTALDSKAGAMPAKSETTDQTGTQTATATGSQNNGDKANGSVTLSNCSNNPVTLPAGTGVSSGGLTYITQSKLSLDSGNFTSGGVCKSTGSHVGSTSIVAQSAGSKYNVSSGSFSAAGYPGVSGSGSASGGTDNVVTILSQSDVDAATQKITTGATASDFTKAWEQKLSDQGEYVLTSTLKASSPVVTSTPAVGQPASTANVSIKTTYTVLTVKKTDLSQAVQDKLASQVDKTKQKLNGDFLNDATVTVQSQSSATTAVLNINVNTTAVPIINVAAVKKQAEGKKVGDIQSAIGNWPGVKTVSVKLSPFWVSKVPKKDGKVTVVIVEVKPSQSKSAP